jgi:hypothetical protein
MARAGGLVYILLMRMSFPTKSAAIAIALAGLAAVGFAGVQGSGFRNQ